MSGPFDGKVALITGGNSGIGKATALLFAKQGARVVIAARRVDEGEATVAEIRRNGGEAIFVKTDVAQAADAEAMVKRAVAEYGRLDCAFNNAGVSGGALLHEVAEADWDRMVGVNLKGVWLGMKYQIIQMLSQGGGGVIVNDSSVAGLSGYARSAHYSATKHGVIGLSKSAALQYLKKGIRINVVCPGMIMTPMIERAFAIPGVEEWFRSRLPGRGGNPDEVAQAVVWLCSDAASYVTGVAFPVDGAASAGLW